MSLDLEHGDAEKAEEISSRQTRRARRTRQSSSTASGGTGETGEKTPPTDTELSGSFSRVFAGISEQLRARTPPDNELADALDESAKGMIAGFMSLTRSVKPLRVPVLIICHFIESMLAFWRVGRILAVRWAERRARRQAEYLAAQQAQAAEQPPGTVWSDEQNAWVMTQ